MFDLLSLSSLFAHANLEPPEGALSGFLHPFLGFDHLLAMVTVGLLSAVMGGRAIWLVPISFVYMMLFGAMLGLGAVMFPFVEYGIACSVLVLGVALYVMRKGSLIWTMLVVGLFGLFHGHAHGWEMPTAAKPYYYVIAFLASTIMLHLSGVFIGIYAVKTESRLKGLRLSGLIIALIGMVLILKVAFL